jgi:hypothetical protein
MKKVIKRVLTYPQQVILGYCLSQNEKALDKAISLLAGQGPSIPLSLWRKVLSTAVLLGETTQLQKIYTLIGKKIVPKSIYLRCGKNAIKKLKGYNAILAYQHAGVTTPKEKLLGLGFKLLNTYKDEHFRFAEALHVFTYLKKPPPTDFLSGILHMAINNYQLSIYLTTCELLEEPPDKTFIKKCFDHYCLTLEPTGVRYAAEVSDIKVSKNLLFELGTRAFKQNKTEAGKEFLRMAYEK